MTAHSLVVVLDGLRPEYIDRELMPNLCAFSDRGVVSRQHHAVYPSETRVQSASIATGCFPNGHGLVNNSLWLPDVRDRPIDTGDAEQLLHVAQSTGGELLTAPSLGELLQSHDKTLFAAGSCTTGANLLLNHERTGLGVFNARGFVAPTGHAETAEREIGPFPETTVPNTEQNRWAFDAYLEFGLGQSTPPDVSVLWLSDPDITTHQYGVGHPQVLESVERLDEELGRLFGELRSRKLRETTNVFVVADHGLSTDDGDLDVSRALEDHGVGGRATVVADTQIYVHEGHESHEIVRALQRTDGVGAIFTRSGPPSDEAGAIPGTLPLDRAHVDHDRAADIIVAPDWSDRSNTHGYPGTTSRSGTAGHGTLSPYEMRVQLIAAGPDLKGSGRRSAVPTGHVDIAPTLLHLHDVRPPASMHGRILHELLDTGPDPDSLSAGTDAVEVSAPDDTGYTATLERTHVDGVTYPAVARVTRDAA